MSPPITTPTESGQPSFHLTMTSCDQRQPLNKTACSMGGRGSGRCGSSARTHSVGESGDDPALSFSRSSIAVDIAGLPAQRATQCHYPTAAKWPRSMPQCDHATRRIATSSYGKCRHADVPVDATGMASVGQPSIISRLSVHASLVNLYSREGTRRARRRNSECDLMRLTAPRTRTAGRSASRGAPR